MTNSIISMNQKKLGKNLCKQKKLKYEITDDEGKIIKGHYTSMTELIKLAEALHAKSMKIQL